MRTRAGRLLAIPYPQEVNDIPAIVARKDGAEQFAAMIVADFEERLRQVARDGQPQVMGIALHPYRSGSPTGCGRCAGRWSGSWRSGTRSGSPPPAASSTMC
ncbi:polysaccharide deacetylase family protein [Teichococcus aestuarii]|uniref:hypothetical protein n=1 Tax=Teichococcus aestuarii TaxID=568898 RepID=UPI003606F77B